MLPKLWFWFFRLTICAAVLCVAMYCYFLFAMSRPHVRQSNGWLSINATVPPETLSKSFPSSATKFRFARSSVGIGGRFLAYAIVGENDDLKAFALREFASHSDASDVTIEHDVQSPFDAEQTAFLEGSYAVNLDWLLAGPHSRGILLRDARGRTSHMPVIFLDDRDSTLYFVRTD